MSRKFSKGGTTRLLCTTIVAHALDMNSNPIYMGYFKNPFNDFSAYFKSIFWRSSSVLFTKCGKSCALSDVYSILCDYYFSKKIYIRVWFIINRNIDLTESMIANLDNFSCIILKKEMDLNLLAIFLTSRSTAFNYCKFWKTRIFTLEVSWKRESLCCRAALDYPWFAQADLAGPFSAKSRLGHAIE